MWSLHTENLTKFYQDHQPPCLPPSGLHSPSLTFHCPQHLLLSHCQVPADRTLTNCYVPSARDSPVELQQML